MAPRSPLLVLAGLAGLAGAAHHYKPFQRVTVEGRALSTSPDRHGRVLPAPLLTMSIPLAGSLQHIYGSVQYVDNPQTYRVRGRRGACGVVFAVARERGGWASAPRAERG